MVAQTIPEMCTYELQAQRPQCRPQLLPRLLQLPVQPGMGSAGQRLPRLLWWAWASREALRRSTAREIVIQVARDEGLDRVRLESGVTQRR